LLRIARHDVILDFLRVHYFLVNQKRQRRAIFETIPGRQKKVFGLRVLRPGMTRHGNPNGGSQ
jgi:hypothetical protein